MHVIVIASNCTRMKKHTDGPWSHFDFRTKPQGHRKMAPELQRKRHEKYFSMTLGLLPARVQKEDSNKLLLAYCSIGGLSLLQHNFTEQERQEYVDFVYSHLVPSGEGFRGSETHQLPAGCVGEKYDPPTIANTYSALCSLLMLRENYSTRLDKDKIISYVKRCQLADGSFRSLLNIDGKPFGDGDLRQCFMAMAIRKMLNYSGDDDVDMNALERYIKSQVVFDGGLGIHESHAGYTFCGLASLKLMDQLRVEEWSKTVEWLIHRQIGYTEYNVGLLEYEFCDVNDQGGHNGRENKFADTCYSFWCTGSLALLGHSSLVDASQMENYLLGMTQNGVVGGFGKTEEDNPDPYHSFLALCALSITSHPEVQPLDPSLVITQVATDFLDSMYK